MTIFDCLKEIITLKKGDLCKSPSFSKEWNTFMITRYLSMDERFACVAERFSQISDKLNPTQQYFYLLKKIPYNRSSYIKYISKPKKT